MKILVFVLFSLWVINSCAEEVVTKAPQETIGTRQADDSVRVIGNLPYSNQWAFERPSNYLYLSYEQIPLASQSIFVSHFETQYSSNNMSVISLDYFSKIFGLADPLGDSFFRKFAFWGRYRIGFSTQSGNVVDDTTGTQLPGEKSSLLIMLGEAELSLNYDWLDWIQPYVGFSYKPYYFRNTSSMTGAETEGTSAEYGPALGLHLPILFGHKGTLFGELHQDMAPGNSNQIFATHLGADFGVGLVF